MSLHIQLLGKFHVCAEPHMPLRVEPPRLQALLAYLLLYPQTAHARQKLAFMLYPESTESQARSNLRNLVYVLRRALPSVAECVHVTTHTLQWNAEADYHCDVSEFERLVSSPAHEDGQAELERLRAAVALYQGDLLPEFYDEWVLPERERLRQQYLSALAQLAAQLRQTDDVREAIQVAQQLLRADPLREESYRLLMQLHAQSGDRASVQRVYQQCVDTLRRELDVAPAAQTAQLQGELLRAEPPTPTPQPHNLPGALTSFVGREQDVQTLQAWLGASRLVTLTGAGGLGKTRLALAVAAQQQAQFADGIWFVDLAPLIDATLLVPTVASVLQLREHPTQPLWETLAHNLSDKQMLLVLDNCEHLIQTCAEFAERLLRDTRGVHILATSREPLRLDGERTWLVAPLAVPPADLSRAELTHEQLSQYDSIRLFTDRARSAQARFALTAANAQAVAHICRALDGMPLAIEMVAARLKVLTVEQIAARLDDRFALLTQGARTAAPRHQTLRAALDWSYGLLTPDERALLHRLSVFAGSFTLEAVEFVCAGAPLEPRAMIDLLASLSDKSWLVVDALQREATYRLLETIRQYAREKMLAEGVADAVRARHLEYYRRLAAQAERELHARAQLEWLERLEREHDNIRAALDWAQESAALEAGLMLCGGLAWFWYMHSFAREGRARTRALLVLAERARSTSASARAWALYTAGYLSHWMEDAAQARTDLAACVALARTLGAEGRYLLATALSFLAFVNMRDDLAFAQRAAAESAQIADALNDTWLMAYTRNIRGRLALHAGQLQAAQHDLSESLELFRARDERYNIGVALHYLGRLHFQLGDHEAARTHLVESMTLHRTHGIKPNVARTLAVLGDVALAQQQPHEAQTFYRQGLEIERALGNRAAVQMLREKLAHLHYERIST